MRCLALLQCHHQTSNVVLIIVSWCKYMLGMIDQCNNTSFKFEIVVVAFCLLLSGRGSSCSSCATENTRQPQVPHISITATYDFICCGYLVCSFIAAPILPRAFVFFIVIFPSHLSALITVFFFISPCSLQYPSVPGRV